jgi:hypothetical protein
MGHNGLFVKTVVGWVAMFSGQEGVDLLGCLVVLLEWAFGWRLKAV